MGTLTLDDAPQNGVNLTLDDAPQLSITSIECRSALCLEVALDDRKMRISRLCM